MCGGSLRPGVGCAGRGGMGCGRSGRGRGACRPGWWAASSAAGVASGGESRLGACCGESRRGWVTGNRGSREWLRDVAGAGCGGSAEVCCRGGLRKIGREVPRRWRARTPGLTFVPPHRLWGPPLQSTLTACRPCPCSPPVRNPAANAHHGTAAGTAVPSRGSLIRPAQELRRDAANAHHDMPAGTAAPAPVLRSAPQEIPAATASTHHNPSRRCRPHPRPSQAARTASRLSRRRPSPGPPRRAPARHRTWARAHPLLGRPAGHPHRFPPQPAHTPPSVAPQGTRPAPHPARHTPAPATETPAQPPPNPRRARHSRGPRGSASRLR